MPRQPTHKSLIHDDNVQSALTAVSAGQFSSPGQAALELSLSCATLYRGQSGGKTHSQAREQQQNLTIPEENALAK